MSTKVNRIFAASVAATLLLSGAASKPSFAVGSGTSAAKSQREVVAMNSSAPSTDDENGKFASLVDSYFDEHFKFNPTSGTEAGFHQYDSLPPDLSAGGISAEKAMNESFCSKFKALDATKLNRLNRIDVQVMIACIEEQLLEAGTICDWQRNPDIYSSTATATVFSLIKRNYAPLENRLNCVIAREERIPELLKAAQINLVPDQVPEVFAQINLEQLPGVISFFQDSLPAAFASITDTALRQKFDHANAEVLKALKEHQAFVQSLVDLGKCNGEFKLGAPTYARLLKYSQMVDTPLDKVLADGYDELHRQQKQFRDLAAKESPGKTTEQYFTEISNDHPKADALLSSTSGVLDEIRSYCIDKNICSIPSKEQARVEETPPFERALTFASMDTPGAYETNAKEAYYFVTLPEKSWNAEKTEEHMRFYSYPDLINTSVHECYPGHYVQFLWSKQYPSKTRKLTGVGSNIEGWAHYCEQMMMEEGLRNHDPKLRMVQLHDALLRCCRYIVALEMHTKSMTLEQAVKFFMEEGYMERANAEREAKRGTSDPTYLVYTLGKMQILALRDDYKKAKGDAFSLKEFHDQFLKCGPIPLKLVRAELLNEVQ